MTSIPRVFGVTERVQGNKEELYPVKTKNDNGIMSLNLLLENDTDPVVWRESVIADAVKQFWTDVIWGDAEI